MLVVLMLMVVVAAAVVMKMPLLSSKPTWFPRPVLPSSRGLTFCDWTLDRMQSELDQTRSSCSLLQSQVLKKP